MASQCTFVSYPTGLGPASLLFGCGFVFKRGVQDRRFIDRVPSLTGMTWDFEKFCRARNGNDGVR